MGDSNNSKKGKNTAQTPPPAQSHDAAAMNLVLQGFLEQLAISNQAQKDLIEENKQLRATLAAGEPRMTAGGHGSSTSNVKLMTELSRRLPKYAYSISEPDSFKRWIGRYDLIFTEDGSELTERERTRLLIGCLEEATFQRFLDSQRDIPDIYNETYCDTVKALNKVFGCQRSLMIRRQSCLSISRSSGEFADPLGFTNHVGESVRDAKLSDMSEDEWSVFIFIRGLDAPGDAPAKAFLMQWLDAWEKREKRTATLSELHDQWIAFMQLKKQSTTVIAPKPQAFPDYQVRALSQEDSEDSPSSADEKEQEEKKRKPWKRPFCTFCKRPGHLTAKCWSKQAQEDQKWTQSLHVDGVQAEDTETLTSSVAVNGIALVFCVDTGSAISIINSESWKLIGRPKLEPVKHQILCANGTALKNLGRVIVRFDINGSQYADYVYVRSKGQNIMGMSWLNHSPKIKSAMFEMTKNPVVAPTKQKADQLSDHRKRNLPASSSQNATRSNAFQVGNPVYALVKNVNQSSWEYGIVRRRFGPVFQIQVKDRRHRCHPYQLRQPYGVQSPKGLSETADITSCFGSKSSANLKLSQKSSASKGAAGRGETNLSFQFSDSSFSSSSPDRGVALGTKATPTRSLSDSRRSNHCVVDSQLFNGPRTHHHQKNRVKSGSPTSSPNNGSLSSYSEEGGEEMPTDGNRADGPVDVPNHEPMPDSSHFQRRIQSTRRATNHSDLKKETQSHSEDRALRRGSITHTDHACTRHRAASTSSGRRVPSQYLTHGSSADGGGVGE